MATRKGMMRCSVRMLDLNGRVVHHEMPVKALGSALLDSVIQDVQLKEPEYFGLQFIEDQMLKWVDSEKGIKKQMKDGSRLWFEFRVRYYPVDPAHMFEELSRYQLMLQIRHDLLQSRLSLPERLATELFALALQSELGDHDPISHPPGYAKTHIFQFVVQQTEELESAAERLHQSGFCMNMTPAEAEMAFLERIRLLDMYGAEVHVAEGLKGVKLSIALTPSCIRILRDHQQVACFLWAKITRITYKSRKFTIRQLDREQDEVKEKPFSFLTSSEKQCKYLWQCAIDSHAFYTTQHANGKAPVKPAPKKEKGGFLRNTRNRLSGRSQHKDKIHPPSSQNVEQTHFERSRSGKYSQGTGGHPAPVSSQGHPSNSSHSTIDSGVALSPPRSDPSRDPMAQGSGNAPYHSQRQQQQQGHDIPTGAPSMRSLANNNNNNNNASADVRHSRQTSHVSQHPNQHAMPPPSFPPPVDYGDKQPTLLRDSHAPSVPIVQPQRHGRPVAYDDDDMMAENTDTMRKGQPLAMPAHYHNPTAAESYHTRSKSGGTSYSMTIASTMQYRASSDQDPSGSSTNRRNQYNSSDSGPSSPPSNRQRDLNGRRGESPPQPAVPRHRGRPDFDDRKYDSPTMERRGGHDSRHHSRHSPNQDDDDRYPTNRYSKDDRSRDHHKRSRRSPSPRDRYRDDRHDKHNGYNGDRYDNNDTNRRRFPPGEFEENGRERNGDRRKNSKDYRDDHHHDDRHSDYPSRSQPRSRRSPSPPHSRYGNKSRDYSPESRRKHDDRYRDEGRSSHRYDDDHYRHDNGYRRRSPSPRDSRYRDEKGHGTRERVSSDIYSSRGGGRGGGIVDYEHRVGSRGGRRHRDERDSPPPPQSHHDHRGSQSRHHRDDGRDRDGRPYNSSSSPLRRQQHSDEDSSASGAQPYSSFSGLGPADRAKRGSRSSTSRPTMSPPTDDAPGYVRSDRHRAASPSHYEDRMSSDWLSRQLAAETQTSPLLSTKSHGIGSDRYQRSSSGAVVGGSSEGSGVDLPTTSPAHAARSVKTLASQLNTSLPGRPGGHSHSSHQLSQPPTTSQQHHHQRYPSDLPSPPHEMVHGMMFDSDLPPPPPHLLDVANSINNSSEKLGDASRSNSSKSTSGASKPVSRTASGGAGSAVSRSNSGKRTVPAKPAQETDGDYARDDDDDEPDYANIMMKQQKEHSVARAEARKRLTMLNTSDDSDDSGDLSDFPISAMGMSHALRPGYGGNFHGPAARMKPKLNSSRPAQAKSPPQTTSSHSDMSPAKAFAALPSASTQATKEPARRPPPVKSPPQNNVPTQAPIPPVVPKKPAGQQQARPPVSKKPAPPAVAKKPTEKPPPPARQGVVGPPVSSKPTSTTANGHAVQNKPPPTATSNVATGAALWAKKQQQQQQQQQPAPSSTSAPAWRQPAQPARNQTATVPPPTAAKTIPTIAMSQEKSTQQQQQQQPASNMPPPPPPAHSTTTEPKRPSVGALRPGMNSSLTSSISSIQSKTGSVGSGTTSQFSETENALADLQRALFQQEEELQNAQRDLEAQFSAMLGGPNNTGASRPRTQTAGSDAGRVSGDNVSIGSGRLSVGAMHHAESMSSISSFQRRQMGRQEQQQQKQQEEAELRMARVPSGLASSHVVASDSTKDVSTAGKSSPKPPAKAPKPPKKGDDERKKHQKEGLELVAQLRKRYQLSPQTSSNPASGGTNTPITTTMSGSILDQSDHERQGKSTSVKRHRSFRDGMRVTDVAPTDITIPSSTSTFGPVTNSSSIGLDHSMALVANSSTIPRLREKPDAPANKPENRESQIIRQNMLQALYAEEDSSDDCAEEERDSDDHSAPFTAPSNQHNGYHNYHDDPYAEYTKRDTGITVDDAAMIGMMASAV